MLQKFGENRKLVQGSIFLAIMPTLYMAAAYK